MEYPKIQSLWKRHCWYFDENCKTDPAKQATRQSFIIGDYASAEFGNIKNWLVDEKIDGMNIRVIYESDNIQFKGRTDNAQMPPDMQAALEAIFTKERLDTVFAERKPKFGVFFGEGHGPKIQSGGYYSKEPAFVIFDIFLDGWWLERSAVKDIAAKLGIEVVPEIGTMTEPEIIEYVKSQPLSTFAKMQPHVAEGVVCRSDPLMLYRNRMPIMWKLKTKEFI
jgi:hypothetical protein